MLTIEQIENGLSSAPAFADYIQHYVGIDGASILGAVQAALNSHMRMIRAEYQIELDASYKFENGLFMCYLLNRRLITPVHIWVREHKNQVVFQARCEYDYGNGVIRFTAIYESGSWRIAERYTNHSNVVRVVGNGNIVYGGSYIARSGDVDIVAGNFYPGDKGGGNIINGDYAPNGDINRNVYVNSPMINVSPDNVRGARVNIGGVQNINGDVNIDMPSGNTVDFNVTDVSRITIESDGTITFKII